MKWAYCTNGFTNHSLPQVVDILAELGYSGVAITLDHGHLHPYEPDLSARMEETRAQLARHGMSAVVETGGRYTLDPWRKHHPTLMDGMGDERFVFLNRAMYVAFCLGAPAVHLWSGAKPEGMSEFEAWRRLADRLRVLLEVADRLHVTLAFEPEPGMLVEDLSGYLQLREMLDDHPRFGLTLDLGHCHCLGQDVVASVREALPYLVHVQIEDMRQGVHEHLEFGEGTMDFPPVLAALAPFTGLVAVELARHSHAAPEVARRSIDFLRRAYGRLDPAGGAGGGARTRGGAPPLPSGTQARRP
ncbi:sugar phosphate isomerase/epimerase [Nonomuraea sp. NN258]|uniref:sugar phosphate isomerase/epimerase family protein n=1 Tax=Nonomuraea antri TaxID=2730852 RepID=UPI0015689B98|nr:sugar phosphate isomerase/epimerase family protein [Nonomuraea antri]NRQ37245.1 sugar phosphate isomerase/epimerase [Nonomuraea antri]